MMLFGCLGVEQNKQKKCQMTRASSRWMAFGLVDALVGGGGGEWLSGGEVLTSCF